MPFYKSSHPIHKALDNAVKGSPFDPNKSSMHKIMVRQKEEYQAKDARNKGNDLIKAEKERLKNKYKK